MKQLALLVLGIALLGAAFVSFSAPEQEASGDSATIEGFRKVEAASVADAMEQLYKQKAYMTHQMRPVFAGKFAGPAVTVLLKKEEHLEGGAASYGMLEAIDKATPGAVYVMKLENGADIAGIGGLMATAMKTRGLAGAVIDAAVRDVPQITRLQFPVFSTGVVPSTSVNHYRFAGSNIPIECGGVQVVPGDIVVADQDGVVIVPRANAAEVLKRAKQLDDAEQRTQQLIPQLRSIMEAVKKIGRI
jgi:4-hydroxy-4-methyl-2-oxoglutarate aldolase